MLGVGASSARGSLLHVFCSRICQLLEDAHPIVNLPLLLRAKLPGAARQLQLHGGHGPGDLVREHVAGIDAHADLAAREMRVLLVCPLRVPVPQRHRRRASDADEHAETGLPPGEQATRLLGELSRMQRPHRRILSLRGVCVHAPPATHTFKMASWADNASVGEGDMGINVVWMYPQVRASEMALAGRRVVARQ